MGCAMASEPAGVEQPIRFGEGYEVDMRPRRLRRGSHVVKLERIPFEILLLLIEHRDEIVTRDQIVSRVWGKAAFSSIPTTASRGAIRKLRRKGAEGRRRAPAIHTDSDRTGVSLHGAGRSSRGRKQGEDTQP